MSFSKISALSGVIALASQVAAHGTVTGIVADGIYYEGYNANFQYMTNPPVVVGWSIPEDQSNGPITPDAYATSDMICHLGATNAGTSAPVAAGGTVELQWTAWPSSHHGPVIDYLANCGGDCTTVDKTTLEWFKIDAQGLYDDTTVPGNWASDTLIANNNSWTVTIPSDIASGNYVLRHEIIALHSAGETNGAQNYPQCVNLMVSGSGTATPSGTLGTALYSATDAGILINIYTSLSTYEIPGPTLYSGAISMSETQMPAATAVGTGVSSGATGSAVVIASSAAETTAAVVASSSAAVVASSSSAAQAVAVVASSSLTTAAPAVTAAPFSNSTVPTSSKSKSACKAKSSSSTKKTKSACKAKSTSASLAVSGLNVAAAQTVSSAEVFTTFAASVTIATTTSPVEASATSEAASVATSAAAASSTTVTEPEGTTLNDLLSWLSSFFSSHSGTTYDANTVARRHARDIAQREMDKFSAAEGKHHATGTAASGAHPTHHHYKPSGTGAGSAKATGHAHHSHSKGTAMPTNARTFKSAGW